MSQKIIYLLGISRLAHLQMIIVIKRTNHCLVTKNLNLHGLIAIESANSGVKNLNLKNKKSIKQLSLVMMRMSIRIKKKKKRKRRS